MRSIWCFCKSYSSLALFFLICSALPAAAQRAMSPSELRSQGLKALQEGNNDLAIQVADAIVRQHQDPRAIRLAADIYLRSGKTEWATRLFNRYAESEPEQIPTLWQRGIALFFTGKYAAAAQQFELHRKVNPNDVENAAWHFLCLAKAKSLAAAKASVLPAPNDPRIPMKEIHALLTSGDTDAINDRVNKTEVGSDERAEAAFYGDFYLALYADAQGQASTALKLMNRAAKDAPRHYMGDIARVYAKHLQK